MVSTVRVRKMSTCRLFKGSYVALSHLRGYLNGKQELTP